jgi:hypothetical protein
MTDTEKPRYLGEALDRILEEVAGFEVDLATDPTLPELGARYLNEKLAECRNYTNRTVHYVQLLKRQERDLRMEMKLAESDLDFKLKEELADNPLVRAQASIEDRVALATVHLKAEHHALTQARAALLETEETVKLVRARLDNLKQTSYDIKLQRQIVKDDREGWGSGDGGYSPPARNKDRTVADGMQAPVRPVSLNPEDLLDPARRPADMPVPVDTVHAAQIASFFNQRDDLPSPEEDEAVPPPPAAAAARGFSYADLLSDD